MTMFRTVLLLVFVYLGMHGTACADSDLHDKTLVAWVVPAGLSQRGGSVLTVDDTGGHFDGIVLGELEPARWMAGSELFHRTVRRQENWKAETADTSTLVQIVIVYRGNTITTYRNGVVYSQHEIQTPQFFDENSVVLIGPRHVGIQQCFGGQIEDARIYDRALSAEQLAALVPNRISDVKPWAWWSFEDASTKELTGRFPHVRLSAGAKVEGGRLVLDGKTGGLYAAREAKVADAVASQKTVPVPARRTPPEELTLNYHLMHPGGDSLPGDPNAAFFLDGVYHLHYIVQHPWRDRRSFSFVHVTSPDMLHWTWQSTKLQPSFTGHGMFSGTGFLTRDGRPAAIYHGESSGRNQIAIAKDRRLDAWEKPFPVDIRKTDGTEATIRHWDPDCFLIGDTYYAISGGENPPLLKSNDLKTWTLVGDFLRHDLPDVAKGEDISCANFFPIGKKWMLLCISHDLGCRYYIGDWDAKAEQFVPEQHGRMNWRRDGQSLFSRESWRADFFAPESVLTPDGRRVMWAWFATLDRKDGRMSDLTMQSLPRELSLPDDGALRIKPLHELESLRFDATAVQNVELTNVARSLLADRMPPGQKIAELTSDAMEVRITIAREEAARKLFGFTLFADGQGNGLPILFRPETGTLRVGTTEAPFSLANLPESEEIVLRIFIDRQVVEVFANDRQAVVAYFHGDRSKTDLIAFTVGAPTTLRSVETWKMRPTNQGFREAQKNRVWEPESK
jgi:beta-fructofuranosidase